MNTLLHADDIHVSFKKENQKSLFGRERQQVLRGISLSLREGECLGIIGESGSGKSTLGRVLSGLLKPERGTVRINGLDTPHWQEDIRVCVAARCDGIRIAVLSGITQQDKVRGAENQ